MIKGGGAFRQVTDNRRNIPNMTSNSVEMLLQDSSRTGCLGLVLCLGKGVWFGFLGHQRERKRERKTGQARLDS